MERVTSTIRGIVLVVGLLFSSTLLADDSFNTNCTNNQNCHNEDVYIYESGQPLIDLYNQAGTTNMNANDDAWSGKVNLGFTFDRWNYNWTQARMSTNGCVNFVGRSDGKNSSNCNDYTPQALPYRNYTLYPFWTDLIRGQSNTSGCNNTWCQSKMLFKSFSDYVVFGWYYMKEYNRSSSNSFEVILWHNDTYEYRYRELDIIQHDVLIGEQGASNEKKTYLFYNDNQNGYNNFDQFLAGYGGPDIENGGSLYSEGLTFEQQCQANPLYDEDCSGYDAAYLTQQCNADSLYSNQCPGYAAAYFAQQCDADSLHDEQCPGYAVAYFDSMCAEDALYDEACPGYWQELAFQESLDGDEDMDMSGTGYTDEELDMYGLGDDYLDDQRGYSDEDMYGYEDPNEMFVTGIIDFDDEYYDYDEYSYDDDMFNTEMDTLYGDGWEDFTEEQWYEIDVREFGQDQVDEWYGEEVEFTEEGFIDWESTEQIMPGDELVALLDGADVYELDAGGVVIFTEEEWIPREDELPEELIEEFEELFTEELQDLEREDLEEFVEFIEENFEAEISEDVIEELIEDEALEELINETELESLLNEETEELFDEEEAIEEEEEALDEAVEEITPAEVSETKQDSRPSRSSMVVAKLKTELGKAASSVVSQQIQDGSGSGGSQGSSYNGSTGSTGSISSQGSSGTIVSQDSTGSSFVQEQQEQATGQIQVDVQVADVVDAGPQISAFEVAEQQQETAEQSQDFTFESSDSFGGGDMDFSNRFDDALSTGQSIGQFLSNEMPNFSKFDVEPPTQSEQRTTKAVESLADQLGEEAAIAQLEANMGVTEEDGNYGDETIKVAVIGYNPGIKAYTGMEQINDQQNWYQVKALYTNAKIDDNKFNFYMMAGKTEKKLKEMIDSQYNNGSN